MRKVTVNITENEKANIPPSQARTGKSATYPSSAIWQDICCNKFHSTSYQEVNCALAKRVESTAATQQTAKVARQVNGVTDVINTLHLRAESEPAPSLPL
jgi:hypothetical protein